MRDGIRSTATKAIFSYLSKLDIFGILGSSTLVEMIGVEASRVVTFMADLEDFVPLGLLEEIEG